MKFRLITFLIFLTASSYGNVVTKEDAKKAAIIWYSNLNSTNSVFYSAALTDSYGLKQADHIVAYIFNFKPRGL